MDRRRLLASSVVFVALCVALAVALRLDGGDGERASLAERDAARGEVMDLTPIDVPAEPTPLVLDGVLRDATQAVVRTSADAERATRATTGDLVVHVTFADGRSAPDIGLRVECHGPRATTDDAREGFTDAEGLARFEGLPAGKAFASADRGGYVLGDIPAGDVLRLEIALDPGRTVVGRVVDARDVPVEGADLWLSGDWTSTEGMVVARSRSDGSFRIEAVSGRRMLGASKAPLAPSLLHPLAEDVDVDAPVVLRLGGTGASFAGFVRDEAGHPIGGATLLIGGESGWRGSQGRSDDGPPPRVGESAPDGSFVFEGLPAGGTNLLVRAAGFAPRDLGLQLVAGERAERDLVLAPGCRIEGRITDAHDRPLAEVLVTSGRYGSFMSRRTQTDASGHYVLTDLAADEIAVTAERRGHLAARAALRTQPDAPTVWNCVLVEGGVIAGRVVDADSGEPAAGWRVMAARSGSDTRWLANAESADDGTFTLVGLGEGMFEVRAVAIDASGVVTVAKVADVAPGGEPVILAVRAPGSPGSVEGALRDAFDEAPADGWVILSPAGSVDGARWEEIRADGHFRFEAVTPGTYVLEAHVQGLGLPDLAPIVVGAQQTVDLGVLRLVSGGTVRARLHLLGEVSLEGLSLRLEAAGDGLGGTFERDGLEAVSETVAAGTYTLVCSGKEVARECVEVIVENGVETSVDVELRAGTRQSIELRWHDGERVRLDVGVTITTADGQLVSAGSPMNVMVDTFATSVTLAPGRYILTATEAGRAREPIPFEVGTTTGKPLVIEMN